MRLCGLAWREEIDRECRNYVRKSVHTHTYRHTHLRIRVVHTNSHTYTHPFPPTHPPTHIHSHTHSYTPTHTYTHLRVKALAANRPKVSRRVKRDAVHAFLQHMVQRQQRLDPPVVVGRAAGWFGGWVGELHSLGGATAHARSPCPSLTQPHNT